MRKPSHNITIFDHGREPLPSAIESHEVTSLQEHLVALLDDVTSLSHQLKVSETLNQALASQNLLLAQELAEVTGRQLRRTLH